MDDKEQEELILQSLRPKMNRLLGLLSVVFACLSSGFASVYFERVLKDRSGPLIVTPLMSDGKGSLKRSPSSKLRLVNNQAARTSLWIRNIQLCIFGLAMGMLIVSLEGNKDRLISWGQEVSLWYWDLSNDDDETGGSWNWRAHRMMGLKGLQSDSDREAQFWASKSVSSPSSGWSPSKLVADFFVGFTPLVWSVVALQILGGLLNALVIKHADNIAKGFATSVSILLSGLLSVILFGFRMTLGSLAGAGMVLMATWLYNQPQSRLPTTVWGLQLVNRPATTAAFDGRSPNGHWSEKLLPNGTPSLDPTKSPTTSDSSHRLDVR